MSMLHFTKVADLHVAMIDAGQPFPVLLPASSGGAVKVRAVTSRKDCENAEPSRAGVAAFSAPAELGQG